jgi:hypothetical protein
LPCLDGVIFVQSVGVKDRKAFDIAVQQYQLNMTIMAGLDIQPQALAADF